MKNHVVPLILWMALAGSASAALWVDFNSNQAAGGIPVSGDPADPANSVHQEAGYQTYHALHEVPASFGMATYATTFSITGDATVTVLPEWTNSTDARVRQSIGRSGTPPEFPGQAGSWVGNNVNLLRDWIGVDARTQNGGNGAWDGTDGTPTYMILRIGGLAAGDYAMRTFHHDVEHMNSFFSIELSTNGGTNFASILNARMTTSWDGPAGRPFENKIFPGTAPNVPGGDPAFLSSTQNFGFTANGTDEVVLRFAPLAPTNDGSNDTIHQMFFGLNGFQLGQIPEPSTSLLGLAGAVLLLRRRR